MEVELLAYTPVPETVCGEAAGTCYRSDGQKALNAAMSGGHESVLEHAVFTFRVKGVSRVLLAQLTRHRLVSFSVESQRYVNSKDNPVYLPPRLSASRLFSEVKAYLETAEWLYTEMVEEGIPKEDARYILPQGITTTLVMTANARELRHIFALRCCNRAQSEIREMAWEMLRLCRKAAQALFADAGPGCLRGKCPEKRPCGRPYYPEKKPEWKGGESAPAKSGFYAAKTADGGAYARRFYIAESGTWYAEDGPRDDVLMWKDWDDAEAKAANLLTDKNDEGDDRK